MAELQSSYTPPEPFVCGKTYKKQTGTNWKGEPVYQTGTCPVKAVDMREKIAIASIVSAFYKLESDIKSELQSLRDAIGSVFSEIDSTKLQVNGQTISYLSTNCSEDITDMVDIISSGLAGDQSNAISKYEKLQKDEDTKAKKMICEATDHNHG